MKTLKNIARNLFIASTIIASSLTASAESSTNSYNDAALFGLNGPVEAFNTQFRNEPYFEALVDFNIIEFFNPDGSWQNENRTEEIENITNNTTFEYDDNGHITKATTRYEYDIEYEPIYDENDNIIDHKEIITSPYTEVYEYEYIDSAFDEYDNWTYCTTKMTIYDENNNELSTNTYYVWRFIRYYE